MRRNLTRTMINPEYSPLVGLKKHFFVESLLLRIRLSTGKKIVAKFEFLPSKSLSKFSMDFSEPCMIVFFIIGIIFFCILPTVYVICCKNDESSVDSVDSMDSPPQTAAPIQVPFQQSNTPPPMHPPTMKSYKGPSTNVPPLPTYTSNPPPPIAGTNQFCSNPPPDLPPPPPYAGSTWN